MAITCFRCGAKATKQFGLAKPEPEPVCNKCFSASGACSGCGKNFGSDAALKIVGQNKNCPDCQAYYEKEVDDLIGGKKRFW